MAYNKNKLSETLANWSRDMLIFYFSKKGLELVSAPHFVYDLWKKNISHVIIY